MNSPVAVHLHCKLPHVNIQTITRINRPSSSTRNWLPALAIASAISVYALIIFGSHVRVTDSGMGCPDWPLCKGNIGYVDGFHAFMEQTHRFIAAIVSVLVFVTALLAVRMRVRPAAIPPALLTGAIILIQIGLGAVTVFAGNNAPTVAAHLLAGLALLGSATVTAVAVLVPRQEISGPRLNAIGWTAIGAAGLLYLSGSLVVNAEAEKSCASIPLCPAGQPARFVLLHLLHRSIAALAAIALFVFAIHAWNRWTSHRGARSLAVTLVTLISATATLGIFSALKKAPADLQDLHLAGAAGVLAISVALATLGWLTGADRKD